jgi:hypothetical protein
MSKLDISEAKRFQMRTEAIRGLLAMPEAHRYQYDIRNLKVGGYFTLDGENWKVLGINRYQETKWNFKKDKKYEMWELEIISLKSAAVHYIEWSVDDQLEIYISADRLKFRDLKGEDDQRVGKSDLDKIADQEGGVLHKGQTYWYDDDESWAAKFYPNNKNDEPELVRFYEFESDDGNSLTIEAWYEDGEDEKFECDIWTSQEVNPQKIQILQLAGEKEAS